MYLGNTIPKGSWTAEDINVQIALLLATWKTTTAKQTKKQNKKTNLFHNEIMCKIYILINFTPEKNIVRL